MNKKKIIYIGILIVIAAIVSIASFSYAFLTRVDEQHGKLNIVAGTLEYKIESDDLENNSITLSANESKEIEITIKSLNKIDSKYQLYTNNVENVEIGYLDEGEFDSSIGTINSNGTKTIKIVLKNNNDTSKTITFGVQGGFESKNITLENNRVEVALGQPLCNLQPGDVINFDYTGNIQTFTAKCAGTYKLETWGAQGGDVRTGYLGGYGGYSSGNINLLTNEVLNVVVGGKPVSNSLRGDATGNACTGANGGCGIIPGGYNGGGDGYYRIDCAFNAGGGATHIAKKSDTDYTLLRTYLNESTAANYVLLVAGGGGGTGYYDNVRFGRGGAGGGLTGTDGAWGTTPYNCEMYGEGGTQNSGGNYVVSPGHAYNAGISNTPAAGFGYGGAANEAVGGNGGGAGWYGGHGTSCLGGGGGGSGYIGGVTNGQTIAGNQSITEPDGTTTTGHSGNGYARITYIAEAVTAPTLTGGTGTGTWGSNAPVISINTPGTARSGIKNYEYYTSTTSTAPTDETEPTGTLSSPYSLEITTKGTTYVYYRAVSNTDAKSPWSSPEVVDLDVNMIPDYGTSIPSSINTLYYTNNGFTQVADSGKPAYYSGNSGQLPKYLDSVAVNNAPNGLPRAGVTRGYIVAGNNTFSMTQTIRDTWFSFEIYGSCGSSTSKYIGSIKLNFSDSTSYTVQQAVNNGYIEPFVIVTSPSSASNYYYQNASNTINGGNTSSAAYANLYYVMKVKNKAALNSVTFYSSAAFRKDHATCYDGFGAYKASPPNDASATPFTIQYKY